MDNCDHCQVYRDPLDLKTSEGEKMNQIKDSPILNQFFDKYQSLEWFSDFLEYLKTDGRCENGDGSWGAEMIECGFALAIKAKKQPVFEVYLEEDDTNIYFIGSEKTILKRVERDLKLWLSKNPQKSVEERNFEQLQKRKHKAQAELEEIKREETKLKCPQ